MSNNYSTVSHIDSVSFKWVQWCASVSLSTAAILSKDPSTKVACSLFNPLTKTIIATGFNGYPSVVDDESIPLEERYTYTVHAEENAILIAAKHGAKTQGAWAIVTHVPCNDCTKSLIQAGIKRILYIQGKTGNMVTDEVIEKSKEMAEKANVLVTKLQVGGHGSVVAYRKGYTCRDCNAFAASTVKIRAIPCIKGIA